MTDFGETTWPKARKPHRCEWCGESIAQGEKHAHFVGKWDGEFQDWRMHSECYDVASEGDELDEGFMPYEHERASACRELPADQATEALQKVFTEKMAEIGGAK
jgi:hypothetical protein